MKTTKTPGALLSNTAGLGNYDAAETCHDCGGLLRTCRDSDRNRSYHCSDCGALFGADVIMTVIALFHQ